MRISINGDAKQVREGLTVLLLLRELKLEGAAVAVAVNCEFVPRSAHATHELRAGDALDIVAPMQGG